MTPELETAIRGLRSHCNDDVTLEILDAPPKP